MAFDPTEKALLISARNIDRRLKKSFGDDWKERPEFTTEAIVDAIQGAPTRWKLKMSREDLTDFVDLAREADELLANEKR